MFRRTGIGVVALALGCGGGEPGDGSTGSTAESADDSTTTGDQPTSSSSSSSSSAADGSSGDTSSSGGDPANVAPMAVFVTSVQPGELPKSVTLDASASSDPDGTLVAYTWNIAGMPDEGPVLTLPLDVGCHAVELTVTDDDGATASTQATVVVAAGEPVLPPVVTIDKQPITSAVLPRDLVSNHGIASFHGTIESNGFTEVRAELLAGDAIHTTQATPLCAVAPLELAVDVPVPAELTAFTVRLSLVAGEQAVPIHQVDDLVAGDLYIINGQSNAAANPQSGTSNENQGPFVRSFGTRTDAGDVADADRVWRLADGDGGGGPASVGQWAIRMGAQLSAAHGVAIGILNGARGGKPIEHFQRNDDDPTDLATNYGRLLTRARNAGIDASLRGILWYQGEADGTDFSKHREGFLALKSDWAEDYPGIERLYVTQLRLGCNANLIRTQEVQRQLADDFPEISVMSTEGLDGHDGCHFEYAQGYRELGDRYAALLGRDLYGAVPEFDVAPPNPASARFAAGGKQIVVTMRNVDSTLVCEAGAAADFRIHAGGDSTVSGCTANGHELVLDVKGDASGATGINYLGHIGAGPWVLNENGVGLLAFWKLPIAPE